MNKSDVGKTYKCIIDDWGDTPEGYNLRDDWYFYVGRTEFMSPEIDGQVFIASRSKLTVGEFYDVKIVGAVDYDLQGEVVE